MESSIELHNDWKNALQAEFQSEYMQKLKSFLIAEINNNKTIYPHDNEIFNAFNLTSFAQTKIVIIGQDPYHGPNQAHGLSFSVQKGVNVPPSLRNIFKELKSDLNQELPDHGNLEHWSKQGVLLLNAVLTVEKSKPASHQNKGWEIFTDRVIELLNQKREHLVFILWGSFAQKKGACIDRNKHLIIQSPHPSPFSAHRGFFGSRPFSQANNYLVEHGIQPIKW
jgi:uracil-DNA glycosylase